MANRPTRPPTTLDDSEWLLGWAVLLIVFDGDASLWERWVTEQGTAMQQKHDLDVVRNFVERCTRNETLRRKIRAVARDLRPSTN